MSNKPNERGILPAIIKALLFFGAYIGSQLIVTTAFSTVFSFISMSQLGEANKEFVTERTNECAMEMSLIASVLTVIVCIFLSVLFKRKPALEAIDIIAPLDRKFSVLGTCLALGVFGQIASLYIINIIPFPQSWVEMLENSNATYASASPAMQIISVAIMAPLCEEIVFRAGVQRSLSSGLPKWAAIILSSLIFGVMHINPIGIIYATLLGILMGWIYSRFNSLLPTLVFHLAFNSTSLILGLFSEIPLAVCIISIVIFIGCIGFLIYLGKLPPVNQNSDSQGDN